MSSSDS